MSRYAESKIDFAESEKTAADKKIEQLRYIERQFKWCAEDWHFELLKHFDEPMKIYSWLGDAKKIGNKIIFNGKTKRGASGYQWAFNHYIGNLMAAFGKIEIQLMENGEILRRFNPAEKIQKNFGVAKILETVI